MSKKKKIKIKKSTGEKPVVKESTLKVPKMSLLKWILPILLVTAIGFFPMLNNWFTNWDDEQYITQNPLLRGPDWTGIFTQPVVSNYHPVTILTLAFNYSLSGLDPTSYLVVNLLLHLCNTALVFYFIWLMSGKKILVAAFTAIVFGIHPMHVESVAWMSERKDVLYTFFFLLSLIQYWYFLTNRKNKNLVYCFVFFALSILSKPAAIILPFILLLLDYWKGRSFTKRTIIEKIPFVIVSIVFAIITVKIQSKTAIAGLDFYPLWTRFFFATYTSMMYLVRFFIPYPLSAFHPFPEKLGLITYLSPVFIAALIGFLWIKRKNKLLVFSFLFFIINLVLVLQVVSIGGTLLAERYTYVPYISIGFLLGMLLYGNENSTSNKRWVSFLIPAIVLIVFAYLTFQRTKVWRNSDTLWTDVLKEYPTTAVPRTNRANYLLWESGKPENKAREKEIIQRAIEDCNEAIKHHPDHAKGYENRQNLYLKLGKDSLALADATSLINVQPANRLGYYVKGLAFFRLNRPDSALKYYNRTLEISPMMDYALNDRGTVLFNYYQRYDEAIADFNKAISVNPVGNYFMNRAKCYYKKGDMARARSDAQTAMQKGVPIDPVLKQALSL